jgi:hypothetical protein
MRSSAPTLLVTALCAACTHGAHPHLQRSGNDTGCWRPDPQSNGALILDIERCRSIELVELYLASIYMTLPSSYGVAELIADDGEPLVPAIALRLERSIWVRDDRTIVDLLILVQEIQRSGSYDAAADVALEKAFRRGLGVMSHEELRDWAVEMVTTLWGSAGPDDVLPPSPDLHGITP